MSAAVRGRPARRLEEPIVGVLEKRGRFLVAEPIFGPGPRPAVERGGAGVAASSMPSPCSSARWATMSG